MLVSVKAVNKTYEKLVVLDDLSLEVPKGDFLAIMGPTGAGKSTLLNLIGGLEPPTSGSVEVDGERPNKKNIGFIFQFYNLHPVLTAFKNVELPLLKTKLSGSQRRQHVETALNIVSLADRASHKPNELSAVQQQRVCMARALVSDPDILVCDEPTAGDSYHGGHHANPDMNMDTATDILNLLQTLNRDHGKTILMATHDPMAADSAKRTLHLDKGKLKNMAMGYPAWKPIE